MAGVLTLLDQPRALGVDGRPTTATVYFYLSGTTILAPVYEDYDLTTPRTNPVTLAAGQLFPDTFLDPSVEYRRRIVYGDGIIYDLDPFVANVVPTADSIIYTPTGSNPREQSISDRLGVFNLLTDKAGSVADGIASNAAAFQAAVSDGGTWIVPRQDDPYVIDTKVVLEDVTLLFEPGVVIKWTGGVAVSDDYVFEARDNVRLLGLGGEWTIEAATTDYLRYSVLIAGHSDVTISGMDSHNIKGVFSKSSTGGTPEGADVYASVVTSGVGANVSENIRIIGGKVRFDVRPTANSHGADAIFYSVGWSVTGRYYFEVVHGLQYWGGDANDSTGNGAIGNERKCKDGSVIDCHVFGSHGGGIWGSMGFEIEVNASSVRDCEDVGFDSEGSFYVRFNSCVAKNCVNGPGAIFFLNKEVEFNSCTFVVDDAADEAFQISNVTQSTSNGPVSLNSCTLICTDTSPSRIVQAAVRELTFNDCNFHNVLVTLNSNNNHITTIKGGAIILPNVGGTPASTFTADPASDVITHSIPALSPLTRVRFSTTGGLPAGLSAGTDYFVTPLTATTCKVSTSVGNAAKGSPVYVDITSAGSGVNTMTIALSAIDLGGNNQIAAVPGKAVVDGVSIYSEAAQPSGSLAVHVAQYDSNASPVSIVKDVTIQGSIGDMQFVWGGSNPGTSGIFAFYDNLTAANSIAVVQSDAANAGTFSYWNNRTAAGVLFNRAAHIADVAPAAGANPTKAEWDAMALKFNAILDILEGVNAGLMAP